MKAKVSPRINLEDRTRLETVIPLSTPYILFVDPSSLCNLKCRFCPSGHLELIKESGRWQGLMDFELYKKIINDLSEFDKPLKVLRLYKEGEPLLHSRFVDMVKHAKDSNIIDFVDTTTNGTLINYRKMKPIIDEGLDKINISVNGLSNEQFLNFTGVYVNFDKYVQNIKDLYKIKKDCEIVIKTTGDFLSEDDKIKFYDTFGDYCDRIFIENASPCWNDFDVEKKANIKITNNKGIYNNKITNVNVCPYIFYSMCINSDGTASLCFLDWQHKLTIGDVRNQSLKKIWNGNSLYHYQLINLSDKRKNLPICKDCGQLKYCMPDDIDQYANELKEKLMNKENKNLMEISK